MKYVALMFSVLIVIVTLLSHGCSGDDGAWENDSIPPEVCITSPHDGDTVRGYLVITASVTDDVAVRVVYFQFFAQENKTWQRVFSDCDTDEPYEYRSLDVGQFRDSSQVKIRVSAYDMAYNLNSDEIYVVVMNW